MKIKKQVKQGRGRYVGTHPWIRNQVGQFRWDSAMRTWLFKPDDAPGERGDWYRVRLESIEAIEEVTSVTEEFIPGTAQTITEIRDTIM